LVVRKQATGPISGLAGPGPERWSVTTSAQDLRTLAITLRNSTAASFSRIPSGRPPLTRVLAAV
jgi:hypothetical protein